MHPLIILGLVTLTLALARLAGWVGTRLGLPTVLAELLTGAVLANLPSAWGGPLFQELATQPGVAALAEFGALLLLFGVGLEIQLHQMREAARDGVLIALLGVITPFALAFVSLPLVTQVSLPIRIFISATLVATSVGITARVLQELGKLNSVSGRLILSAAVFDDVLGIIILAIVTFMAAQGGVQAGQITWLLTKVALFFVLFLEVIGPTLDRLLTHPVSKAPGSRVSLMAILAGSLVFSLSGALAHWAGLSAFIGTFMFGLVLSHRTEVHALKPFLRLVGRVSSVAVPLFFVSMGLLIRGAVLLQRESLLLSALLIACAIAGKLACGLGVSRSSRARGADAWLIALGMIPRGEVGLLFAQTGLRSGILHEADYASVLSMAFVTTLVCPGLLSWRAKRIRA